MSADLGLDVANIQIVFELRWKLKKNYHFTANYTAEPTLLCNFPIETIRLSFSKIQSDFFCFFLLLVFTGISEDVDNPIRQSDFFVLSVG